MHWHRLGERCRCGHLTVPARFYEGGTHEQAEAAYLEHLKEHMPERYEKLVEPSRPITRKHKNLAAVEAALRERTTKKAICEEPSEEKPHATKVPGRLRGRK